jgi:Fic family protein
VSEKFDIAVKSNLDYLKDRLIALGAMPGHTETRTWSFNPAAGAPASYRKACKYHAFIPDQLASVQLSLDAETAGAVSEAENAVSSLNHLAEPGLKPLARLLLRTESIASSKVEGMQLGVRALAKAETIRDTGAGKIGTDAAEILANIDAMDLAIEKAAAIETFSVAEIEAIHRLLMDKAWNAHVAGRVRTTQNWIGGNDYNPCGADFVPPPPEQLEPLLDDLCKTINDVVLPPLVQAALVHAQFETIHPFEDGNGRTGRALIHVVLKKRGLATSYVPPVSVILARSKARYINGLTTFRQKDGETAWIRQFAEATTSAANLAQTYLSAIQSLTDGWREKLKSGANPRADSVAWKIISVLPAHPMITGPVAEAATGGVRSSVNIAIEQLTSAGVLIPVSNAKKNRSWEAAGLLYLIAQLEAGQLPDAAFGIWKARGIDSLDYEDSLRDD